MSNCCLKSVPPDSSLKAFGQPFLDWQRRLVAGLDRSIDDQGYTLATIKVGKLRLKVLSLERILVSKQAIFGIGVRVAGHHHGNI